MDAKMEFTETNIQRLFGHEAAEDEDPERLAQYYFKTGVFDRVTADLRLRVIVGHKGIGKSALLKVAITEDNSRGRVTVLIQPNDITDFGRDATDFLHTVRSWTEGLRAIILKKSFASLGIHERALNSAITRQSGIVESLVTTISQLKHGDNHPGREQGLLAFMESPSLSVYLDDLDRGWLGRREDVVRISALLNAVRDLSNTDPRLSFKLALRSDVYYLVRTSDESTDKIESSVVWHTWTNHDIFILLIKRIETYFGREVDEERLRITDQPSLARYLDPVMEPRFAGEGKWNNAPMYRILMSLTRKRPRDLVKLCTLAARKSYERGGNRIQTQDFRAIFEEYSQGRIQDTVNEYRSELPAIERVLMNMKPNKNERTANEGYVYRTEALLHKLDNIMELGTPRFANGSAADSKELAAFLYKINFLTARKITPAGIERRYFEEQRYLQSRFADFGFQWEVHPAYRWALQPGEMREIFANLDLTVDQTNGKDPAA